MDKVFLRGSCVRFMQNLVHNVDVLTQGLKYSISGLMNLANQTTDPQSRVFFVNFNQDCT